MTHCNRCGNDFENFFNGMHWCPNCGKSFAFDENILKKKRSRPELDEIA